MHDKLTLLSTIRSDLKEATDKREKMKAQALRMLLSEIEYADVTPREGLDDDHLEELLHKHYEKLAKSKQLYPEGERREEISAEMDLIAMYLRHPKDVGHHA